MSKEIYLAFNRKNKTVAVVDFPSYDALRAAFRFGIALPDGSRATGIGRTRRTVEELPDALITFGHTLIK